MKTVLKVIYKLRYYLLTFLCLDILLSLLDYFVFNIHENFFIIFLFVFLSTLCVILVDGICAALFHKLPEKLIDPNKRIFHVYKFEKKLYNFLKVKKWKDKIPEIGELTCDFGKDKIENPSDPKYLMMFIKETCYAEIIHNISCIFGFLIIFILPLKYWLYIGLPIGIFNIFFNLLSSIIQRFNRPKLLLVYERKTRK